MVSKKGKRKFVYNDKIFYWFVRKNSSGVPRIHILSEDKAIHLERHGIDSEEPAVPSCIRRLLDEYYAALQ